MRKQNRRATASFAAHGLAAGILLGCLTSAPDLNAQFIRIVHNRPTVPVTISHPAGLAVTLAGKKVALGPVTGNCAQQFADMVAQDLVRQKVTLVNRGDLDAILAEHHFQVTSSVDPTTAVALGKVLGPAVMLFLTVSRCDARRDGPLYEGQAVGPRTNISRTEAHFLGSVHTVDLATGRELGVNTVKADPLKENRAQAPQVPEYPSEYDVQDAAFRAVAAQVSHLYFPWGETREVPFMNGKECNLKQAYDLLKSGDTQGALKLSRENVEACRSEKPTHQADALYNLGILQMFVRDYDGAMAALTESQRLHPDRGTVDAIAECRAGKEGAAAVAAGAQQAADEAKAEQEGQQRRDEQSAKSTLTNEYVVKLVKGGLSEDIIAKMIATQPAKFATGPDDLLALKQAGVPDKVIAAMLDKK